MKDNSFDEEKDELKELVRQFQNMKSGKGHSFLDEEAYERIVDYFDDIEDITQALEAVEMGLEHYPYSSMLHIKKADLYIATRRYHEALDILGHAELLDRNNINLYILKTDAYLALDQQEKAVDLLENALNLFSGEERIEMLFELADVYDDYEQFDKIFDCLELILKQDPLNEEALYKICFWTDFTGRNEEGVKLHQDIIEDHPYSELAWFNLGAAFQGLKLYEKAIDAYKYAVAIDEKFDYAYRNMGDAYIRLRKFKDAIESLERVLELSRPEDVIYEAIGHCYDKLKNYAQARFYYKKASHLNQEDSKLHYKIACTYINEGQWNAGMKQLQVALQIHRLQPEYNLVMGECKMHLGEYKEAIQYFSNVVSQRPKNISSWEALVRCLYQGEYYEEALDQTFAAIKHTENKPLFTFYLTAIYMAMGKTKEAMIQLENAMQRAPRLLKKLIDLNPSILQHQQVVDIVARFKKSKSI